MSKIFAVYTIARIESNIIMYKCTIGETDHVIFQQVIHIVLQYNMMRKHLKSFKTNMIPDCLHPEKQPRQLFERKLALLVALQGESIWKGVEEDAVSGSF